MKAKRVPEVKEAEGPYRTIFENLPFVAFTLDREGRVLEANKYTEKLFGMRIGDVKDKKFSEIGMLGKKDLIKAFIEFRKNLQGEVTGKTVYKVKLKGEKELLLELIGIPLKEGGKVTRVLDVGRNITGEKEIEEKFHELFEKMPDAVIILDRKGTFLETSDEAERISGYKKSDVLGKNLFMMDILDAKTKAMIIKKMALHFSGRKVTTFEIKIKRKDGKVVPLEINAEIIDYMGKKAEMVILRDITERERVEKELRESEEHMRTILDSIQSGIVIIDAETHNIIDVNPTAVKMIGDSKEKIIGSVCHKYICPAERGKCPITDLGQKVDNSERILLKASGERVPILKTVSSVVLKGRKCLLENFVNITERKKVEKEIKRRTEESEKFARLGVGRELKMVELKKRIKKLETLLRKHGVELKGKSK